MKNINDLEEHEQKKRKIFTVQWNASGFADIFNLKTSEILQTHGQQIAGFLNEKDSTC